jgi:hypothetical protein
MLKAAADEAEAASLADVEGSEGGKQEEADWGGRVTLSDSIDGDKSVTRSSGIGRVHVLHHH